MSVNTTLAARALSPAGTTGGRSSDTAAGGSAAGTGPALGFEDLIDTINPLQQLPVVSAVYREATGDTISIPARLAGGFLFGGPTGLAGAAAMVLFEAITGDSVLGHLKALGDAATDEPAGPAAAPLPWLAAPGREPPPAPAAASGDSVAEALKRREAPAAPTAAAPLPDALPPHLLARLYALQATDARGADAVRL
ncbi:hypothetical protein [Azospirillum halopraeferens]|uniref:hypothetical protein n=1 Tax=Azospirillum halopraeferens TaxID=34010 RepID=UPI0004296AD4|nr:hypothetical protein [Azospirillum halopraeferens]